MNFKVIAFSSVSFDIHDGNGNVTLIEVVKPTSARVIERAYMLKLDFTSTELWETLGSEFEHFPKNVLHNIEIKFSCSKGDIAEATKWVNDKYGLRSEEFTNPATWTRSMQVSTGVLKVTSLLSQVQ